jgi:membrane protein YdbS with pleckstrin-like domain
VEAGDSSGVVQPAASAAVGGAVAADTRPPDRAERAGYPPDYGPEQAVLRVRPAFFRPNVLSVVGLIVGPALLALAAWWVAGEEYGPIAARWIGIVLGGAAVLFIAGWWFLARYSYMLEITNKRAVEHIGLFSKTTDEVLHDHVRNVTIEQSFYDRVMNVGRIGIASAGHGDTEINMDNMPRPKKIREVIDLYRPVG